MNGKVLHEGDMIAIDGTRGIVTTDDVPLVDPEFDENFETVLGLGRRDPQARRARQRGHAGGRPQGPSVRRRGHRPLPHGAHVHGGGPRAQDARDDHVGERGSDRRAALAELLPLQQQDFEGLFEEMAGLPVTIRLLDPPLHEFLPGLEEVAQEVERARIEQTPDLRGAGADARKDPPPVRDQPDARHARLPARHPHPEIYEMQVSAIIRAARAVKERSGETPHLEIMIPLVAYETELMGHAPSWS